MPVVTPTHRSPRPAAWAMCRALTVLYGLFILPAAIVSLFLLLAAGALSRGERWAPIVSWLRIVTSVPRVAGWLERRLGDPRFP